MQPTPCAHCAMNFMQHTIGPDMPKLCNNCLEREKLRNPKKDNEMSENIISLLIECPAEVHKEIEEYCMNNGMSLSAYFLSIHQAFKDSCEIPSEEIADDSVSEKKTTSKKQK